MLSDKLGNHYNAEELMRWVADVAREAAIKAQLQYIPPKGKKNG
jgi:hypothetical protein